VGDYVNLTNFRFSGWVYSVLSTPAQTEEPAKEEAPAPEPPREEGKRKRNKLDYEALFIRESNTTARLGKMVYIRREFHDRIQKIVQVIGGNEVSLFSYIDNLIAHHFETFREDITENYKKRAKQLF
jgi:hypothetical protein